MKGYAILIEKGKTGFGASVPDLPGCYAFAKTRRGVRKLIREGIAFHIDGMREDGETIPEPTCTCATVEVDFPPARGRAPARSRRKSRQPG